jgi:hypothetical protein
MTSLLRINGLFLVPYFIITYGDFKREEAVVAQMG